MLNTDIVPGPNWPGNAQQPDVPQNGLVVLPPTASNSGPVKGSNTNIASLPFWQGNAQEPPATELPPVNPHVGQYTLSTAPLIEPGPTPPTPYVQPGTTPPPLTTTMPFPLGFGE